MMNAKQRAFFKSIHTIFMNDLNYDKRDCFESLQEVKHYYSLEQKDFALTEIDESGIRATSRILGIPRRTLQRWCRTYGKPVKRCPSWVYERAYYRRKRREFWESKGYF